MKKLTYRQRAILCVIGAFLLTSGSGFAGSLSLFLIPVTEEMGFSQASFSVYVSFMSLGGIITHPILGKVFVRYAKHIRLITALAAVFGFMCLFVLSRSSALYQFYIGGAMLSALMPFVGSMLGTTVVSWWFESGRSIAISFVVIGMSSGVLISSKITSYYISEMGWRAGYVAQGAVVLAFVLAASFLISPPPETPGSRLENAESAKCSVPASETLNAGISLHDLLKMPSFLLFCASTFVGMVFVMLIQQSLVPLFQADLGQTATYAAGILSVYSIISACSKPVLGIIYKRFGHIVAILYTCLIIAAASFILFFTAGMTATVIGMILLGVGNVMLALLPALEADAFGAANYPVAAGYINIFFTFGAGIGPVLTGRIFDLTGSYRLAFLVIAVLSLITAVLLLAAARRSKA